MSVVRWFIAFLAVWQDWIIMFRCCFGCDCNLFWCCIVRSDVMCTSHTCHASHVLRGVHLVQLVNILLLLFGLICPWHDLLELRFQSLIIYRIVKHECWIVIDRDFRHLDLYWSWELLDWHLHLLKREGNIFFRSDIQSLDPFIICCLHNVDASGPAIGELALCLVERAASLILGLSVPLLRCYSCDIPLAVLGIGVYVWLGNCLCFFIHWQSLTNVAWLSPAEGNCFLDWNMNWRLIYENGLCIDLMLERGSMRLMEWFIWLS